MNDPKSKAPKSAEPVINAPPTDELVEQCGSCTYFAPPFVNKALENRGLGERPGRCRRYPKGEPKDKADWCGEWAADKTPGYQG